MQDIYIAACATDGGIYHYKTDGETAELKQFVPIDRPMYFYKNDKKLYAVLRAPFEDSADSGIISFDIGEDGNLFNPSEIISTKGEVGCHLAVTGDSVYVANYISGSVFKSPDKTVAHGGRGTHKTRQEAPHVHSVTITPDGNLCVADLGIDTLFIYDKDLNEISKVKLPDGSGPRHTVFSEDGKYLYCVAELDSCVYSFSYDNGVLIPCSSSIGLPVVFTGESTAAAIRISGNKLYTSNRGHNSISEFDVCDGNVKLVACIDCGGEGPRDFNIFDDFAVCTNQDTNNVVFYKLNSLGRYAKTSLTIDLPTPICVI